jgi:hypothetical protein
MVIDIYNICFHTSALNKKLTDTQAVRISQLQLFHFYCRTTKSDAPMKKATFMEFVYLESLLQPPARQLLLEIFDTAKGYGTFMSTWQRVY